MILSLPTLIGCMAILLWSCLALFTAATGIIPPFELAAITFAISGAAGLALAAIRSELGALKQPPAVWALGIFGLFGYHALYFSALRLAPPGHQQHPRSRHRARPPPSTRRLLRASTTWPVG